MRLGRLNLTWYGYWRWNFWRRHDHNFFTWQAQLGPIFIDRYTVKEARRSRRMRQFERAILDLLEIGYDPDTISAELGWTLKELLDQSGDFPFSRFGSQGREKLGLPNPKA